MLFERNWRARESCNFDRNLPSRRPTLVPLSTSFPFLLFGTFLEKTQSLFFPRSSLPSPPSAFTTTRAGKPLTSPSPSKRPPFLPPCPSTPSPRLPVPRVVVATEAKATTFRQVREKCCSTRFSSRPPRSPRTRSPSAHREACTTRTDLCKGRCTGKSSKRHGGVPTTLLEVSVVTSQKAC